VHSTQSILHIEKFTMLTYKLKFSEAVIGEQNIQKYTRKNEKENTPVFGYTL
jgi:hypothetical protein